MSGKAVCVLQKPAEKLKAGDIVVSHGEAQYLTEQAHTVSGWIAWNYTRHAENGDVIGTGRHEWRADVQVTVVCVTVDGTIVVPD